MKTNGMRRWAGRLATAIAGTSLVMLPSCPLAGREFRDAAGPAVESGVTQVVNGLLSGLFAVIEPEPQTTSAN